MRVRSVLIVIIFLFLASLILTGCASAQSFHGTLAVPAGPAPEINLADQNGNLVRLSDWKGQVVLVFFGFTNCPDECPLTAAHLKQTLELLGDRARDVRVVMVSTDPVRDTPQGLKEFLDKFNSGFVGIPGTAANLSPIWNGYGVIVLNGGETHSSFIYVVDRAGDLRLTLTADMEPEKIASDLKILLAEQQ